MFGGAKSEPTSFPRGPLLNLDLFLSGSPWPIKASQKQVSSIKRDLEHTQRDTQSSGSERESEEEFLSEDEAEEVM